MTSAKKETADLKYDAKKLVLGRLLLPHLLQFKTLYHRGVADLDRDAFLKVIAGDYDEPGAFDGAGAAAGAAAGGAGRRRSGAQHHHDHEELHGISISRERRTLAEAAADRQRDREQIWEQLSLVVTERRRRRRARAQRTAESSSSDDDDGGGGAAQASPVLADAPGGVMMSVDDLSLARGTVTAASPSSPSRGAAASPGGAPVLQRVQLVELIELSLENSPSPTISRSQCDDIVALLSRSFSDEDELTRYQFLGLLSKHCRARGYGNIDVEGITQYLFVEDEIEISCLKQLLAAIVVPSRHSCFAGSLAQTRCKQISDVRELFFFAPFLMLYLFIVLSGKFVTPRSYMGFGASLQVSNQIFQAGFPQCAYGGGSTSFPSNCSDSNSVTLSTMTRPEDFYTFLAQGLGTQLWPASGNAGAGRVGALLVPVGALKVRNMLVDPSVGDVSEAEDRFGPNTTIRAFLPYDRDTERLAPLDNFDASAFASYVLPPWDGSLHGNCAELNASGTFLANSHEYNCGGHAVVVPFRTTRAELQAVVDGLHAQNWISAASRATIAEFFLFHPQEAMLLRVRIVSEFRAGGGISTTSETTPFAFFSLASNSSAVTGGYVTFFIYLILMILRSIVVQLLMPLRSYLSGEGDRPRLTVTLALDFANYALFLVSAIARVVWYLGGPPADPVWLLEHYPNSYEKTSDLFQIVVIIDSFNIILSVLGLLRYAQHLPGISFVVNAVARAASDAFWLIVIILGVFMSLVVAANVTFGSTVMGYHTIPWAAETLGQVYIGNYDYTPLHTAQPAFSFCYFFVFQIIMAIILLNMFVAVFSDAFAAEVEEAFDSESASAVIVNNANHTVQRARALSAIVSSAPLQLLRDYARGFWNTLRCRPPPDFTFTTYNDKLLLALRPLLRYAHVGGRRPVAPLAEGEHAGAALAREVNERRFREAANELRLEAATLLLRLVDRVGCPVLEMSVPGARTANIYDLVRNELGDFDFPLVMSFFVLVPQALFGIPGETLIDSAMTAFRKWQSGAAQSAVCSGAEDLLFMRVRAIVDERTAVRAADGGGAKEKAAPAAAAAAAPAATDAAFASPTLTRKASRVKIVEVAATREERFLATLDFLHRRLFLGVVAVAMDQAFNDEDDEGGGGGMTNAASFVGGATGAPAKGAAAAPPPRPGTTGEQPEQSAFAPGDEESAVAAAGDDPHVVPPPPPPAATLGTVASSVAEPSASAFAPAASGVATAHGGKRHDMLTKRRFADMLALCRQRCRESSTDQHDGTEFPDISADDLWADLGLGELKPGASVASGGAGSSFGGSASVVVTNASMGSGSTDAAAAAAHAIQLRWRLRVRELQQLACREFGAQCLSFDFSLNEVLSLERYLLAYSAARAGGMSKDAAADAAGAIAGDPDNNQLSAAPFLAAALAAGTNASEANEAAAAAKAESAAAAVAVASKPAGAASVTFAPTEPASAASAMASAIAAATKTTAPIKMDADEFRRAWRHVKKTQPLPNVVHRVFSLYPDGQADMRAFLHFARGNVNAPSMQNFESHFCAAQSSRTEAMLWLAFFVPLMCVMFLMLFIDENQGEAIWMATGLQQTFTPSLSTPDIAGAKAWLDTAVAELWRDPAGNISSHNNANYFVGAVRFRQHRVSAVDCTRVFEDYFGNPKTRELEYPSTLEAADRTYYASRVGLDYSLLNDSLQCLPAYSFGAHRSTAAIVPTTDPLSSLLPEAQAAFAYSTADSARGGDVVDAHDSTYTTGGYALVLSGGLNGTYAKQALQQVLDNGWIDDATRLVVLEFVAYNFNLELIALSRFGFELTAGGTIYPVSTISIANVLRASTVGYLIVSIFMALLIAVYIYLTVRAFGSAVWMRIIGYGDFWLIAPLRALVASPTLAMDVAIILTSVGTFASRVAVSDLLTFDAVHNNGEWPKSLADGAALTQSVNKFAGANTFLVILRFIIILSIGERRVATVLLTLRAAARDLAAILSLWIFSLFSFTLAAVILFGYTTTEAFNLQNAFFDLFNTASGGNPQYYNYTAARRQVAPVFYIVYIIVCFFVLYSMVVAVLTGKFSEIKANIYNSAVVDEVMKQVKHERWFAPEPGVLAFLRNNVVSRELLYAARLVWHCGRPPLVACMETPRVAWKIMTALWRDVDTGVPLFAVPAAAKLLTLGFEVTRRVREREAAEREAAAEKSSERGAAASSMTIGRNRRLSHRHDAPFDGSTRDHAPELRTFASRRVPVWAEYVFYRFGNERDAVHRFLVWLPAALLGVSEGQLWQRVMEENFYFEQAREKVVAADAGASAAEKLLEELPPLSSIDEAAFNVDDIVARASSNNHDEGAAAAN